LNELLAFLETRKAKFQNPQNLARMMRVTFSGLLRGLKSGTLSTENCFRLAEVLAEDPAVVLRIAKKGDVADQIERMYRAPKNPISVREREFLDRISGMSDEDLDLLERVMDRFFAATPKRAKKKTA